MRYFDALTSSYFKTAPDGRRLFFPWGVLGSGYIIPSESQFERMRRQLRIYTVAMLTAIIVSAGVFGPAGPFVAGAVFVLLYLGWLPTLRHGLTPSQERLSLKDSMTTQARTHSALGLWTLQFVALGFVAGGIAMLIINPADALTAWPAIIFFGICSLFMARMLFLRRQATAQS